MSRPAIGFDFDGTLVTCRERQLAVLEHVLSGNGVSLPIDLDRHWRAKRAGATTASALCEAGLDSETAARIARRWVESVEGDHFLALDQLQPGAGDILAENAGRATLHVISARQRKEGLERQMEDLGIMPYLASWHVVEPGKGADARKAALMNSLSLGTYLGDTENDLAASRAAGVRPGLVSTGQRDHAFLASAIAAGGHACPLFYSLADCKVWIQHATFR